MMPAKRKKALQMMPTKRKKALQMMPAKRKSALQSQLAAKSGNVGVQGRLKFLNLPVKDQYTLARDAVTGLAERTAQQKGNLPSKTNWHSGSQILGPNR
jgi:hypothetical protein